MLISILISNIAFAIDCPSIDYRNRFTPLRDQDGNGLCWAFAGSALIEEEMCLEDQDKCGELQVSVIDGHRCYWDEEHGLGTKTTGAFSTGLYTNCVLKGGVCSEENSPFVKAYSGDTQSRQNSLVGYAFKKTLLARIQSGVYATSPCFKSTGDVTKFTKDFAKIVEHLIKNMADEYMDLNINYKKALLTAKHYTDALKGILISEDCRQNRFYLKNKKLKPVLSLIKDMSANKRLSVLASALQSGRSASLGLCGKRAMKGRYEDLFFMSKWGTSKEDFKKEVEETECGPHAVVVNGMRMHDGRCQIHIRNSWGAGSGLEGWEDAQNILSHTITVEYMTDKKYSKDYVETSKLIK